MKRAFSLIELLIVIVIVGAVYALTVTGLTNIKDKTNSLTMKNLREYLQDIEHTKSVKLLCLDDCSSCDIFVDGEKYKTLENFADENVKIYRYELNYGFTEEETEVYFNNDDVEVDVCFSYEVDRNGIGNQVLVELKDKYYDFYPYFKNVKVYDSLEEASEVRENLIKDVMQ